MAKTNSNAGAGKAEEPRGKVVRVEDMLAAKRARNESGLHQAAVATQKTSEAIRAEAGKAKRTELQTELIQTAELAYADGEGDGIKQFLEEDIPAVVSVG